MDRTSGERARNPKGQGERLRDEIVAAARRILEASGSEAAVTLRATAREAGVTAPAIYAHFADREEMVEAVIAAAFAEFAGEVLEAMRGIEEPGGRLRVACESYIAFGRSNPATYGVIFTRPAPSAMPDVASAASEFFGVFVELIQECRAAGLCEGVDATEDAVMLWLGVHGLASLPPSHPRFPWPDRERALHRLLEGAVGLAPGAGRNAKR